MAENITIQFKATGGAALKKTIDSIWAANERLTKGQTAYVKAIEAAKQSDIAAIKAKQKLTRAHKQEQDEIIQVNKLRIKRERQQAEAHIENEKRTAKAIAASNKRAEAALKAAKREAAAEKKREDAALRAAKKRENAELRAQARIARAHVAASKKVKQASEKASRGLFQLGHDARNTSGAFSVLRSQMLLASFAASLAIRPILNLAKAAGDMQEIINKSTVVFGDNFEIVQRWSNELGDSVGRASSTLLEMASSLQDTFVPLGFTREASTKLSTSLTELALDVASFSNKLDADVIRDFQSAIVGNHETVKKYGVIINEALLKQEAFILGISDGTSELSASEKVQARVSLITKGSADAIGDLKATQDSYNNTLKRFNNFWIEAREKIGEALQPIIQAGAAFLSNERHLKAFAFSVSFLATMFTVLRTSAFLASISMQGFTKALIKTGIGAAVVVLGYLAEAFLFTKEKIKELKDETDSASDIIDEYTIEVEKAVEAQKEMKTSVQDSVDSLIREIVALGDSSAAAEYSRKVKRSLTDQEVRLVEMLEKEKKALKLNNDARKLIQRTLQTDESLINDNITAITNYIDVLLKQGKAMFRSAGDAELFDVMLNRIRQATSDDFDFRIKGMDAEDISFLKDLFIQIKDGEAAIAKLKAELDGLGEDDDDNNKPKTIEFNADPVLSALADIAEATGGVDLGLFNMATNFLETIEFVERDGKIVAENLKEAYAQMAAQIGSALVQAQMQASEARMAAIKEKAQKDIEEFKSTDRFNKLSQKQKKTFEAQKLKIAQKAMKKEFENQKEIKRAGVIMNTAAAIMNIWGSATMGADPITKGILTGLVTALGALQLETINTTPPPKMAKGGYVGGRLHSQGGTMIEAERGEFVMSRDAVDSVGLETMNRINQGGGAGVNVSFSGNVMSGDFIENEAIPKIKEAIRRGADIGVS